MFTAEQIEKLSAPLSRTHVKQRVQGGSQVSYIAGWHAIDEANRIFGYDAWTRETVETKCVAEKPRKIGRDGRDGWGVSYIAKVRICVISPTGLAFHIERDGTGAGHGIDVDLGQAHESAIKEAETDAMKRALMTFGNPFGLALYDKEQVNVCDDDPPKEPPHVREITEHVTDGFRQKYKALAREKIAASKSKAELLEWWNSSEQKAARKAAGLFQSDVDDLIADVQTRIAEFEKEAA